MCSFLLNFHLNCHVFLFWVSIMSPIVVLVETFQTNLIQISRKQDSQAFLREVKDLDHLGNACWWQIENVICNRPAGWCLGCVLLCVIFDVWLNITQKLTFKTTHNSKDNILLNTTMRMRSVHFIQYIAPFMTVNLRINFLFFYTTERERRHLSETATHVQCWLLVHSGFTYNT